MMKQPSLIAFLLLLVGPAASRQPPPEGATELKTQYTDKLPDGVSARAPAQSLSHTPPAGAHHDT